MITNKSKNKREEGFYWVQYHNSGNWTICEWKNDMWHHKGASYKDFGHNGCFKNIDERKIVRKEF
jgi:hypothetical protein